MSPIHIKAPYNICLWLAKPIQMRIFLKNNGLIHVRHVYMYVRHVYRPRLGLTTHWGQIISKNTNLTSIWLLGTCLPLNDFVTVYPIQTHARLNLTLPWNRSSTQGDHLYTLCRAWAHDVAFQVQDHRTFWLLRRICLRFRTYVGVVAILVIWPGPFIQIFVPFY